MSQAIPSLERSIREMHLLAESDGGFTPAELARRADMSRATAFRVLKTLQTSGMAEKRGSVYLPGPQLLQMAARVLNRRGLRDAAIPIMRQLAETIGQTTHVAVRTGDRALILEVCDGPQILRVASRPGTLAWMHCSATGKAILSTMDDADAEASLERAGYERLTDRTLVDWSAMRSEFSRTRRRGYAVDDREYDDDVRCIAAPVLLGDGPADTAIGVTGPAAALTLSTLSEVGEEVKAAAGRLAARLSGDDLQKTRLA